MGMEDRHVLEGQREIGPGRCLRSKHVAPERCALFGAQWEGGRVKLAELGLGKHRVTSMAARLAGATAVICVSAAL